MGKKTLVYFESIKALCVPLVIFHGDVFLFYTLKINVFFFLEGIWEFEVESLFENIMAFLPVCFIDYRYCLLILRLILNVIDIINLLLLT